MTTEPLSIEETNRISAVQSKLALEGKIRGGMNWFYWIAGLSVLNTVISLAGGSITFVVGLGITQIVSYIVKDVATLDVLPVTVTLVSIVGILFNLGLAGMFAGIGVFARRKIRAVIILGLFLYGLDTLLILALGDIWAFGFHCLALFFIYAGYRAIGTLEQLESGGPIPIPENLTPKPPFSSARDRKEILIVFIGCVICLAAALIYWVATGAK